MLAGWARTHARNPLTDDPALRTAALLWLAGKITVIVLGWAASWIFNQTGHSGLSLATDWQHWDAKRFLEIAQYGYIGPPGTDQNQVAFFPGYPLALRAVHLVIPSWAIADLALATAASFFAVLGLARLAEDQQAGSGARAVLFLLAAPAAVFLSACYSEAFFLAFALPSWLAARRGSWTAASLLAAAACMVRVNGLFLAAGLVVMAACSPSGRRLSVFARLILPAVPVAAYELYLRYLTGDWLAWLHAENAGWDRGFENPLTTFRSTWAAATGPGQVATVTFTFQIELVAVAVLALLVVVLLAARRWPEAVYCLLTLVSLTTGYWYESVSRDLLLAWPLWCQLGAAAGRYRKSAVIWLAVSIPLMCVIALLYALGSWAG